MLGVASWCRRDLAAAAGTLEEASCGLRAMRCWPLAALCLYDLCEVLDEAGGTEALAQARLRLHELASGLDGPLFAALLEEPAHATGSFARLGLRMYHARALARAGKLAQAVRV
jgi:hypothetical protein